MQVMDAGHSGPVPQSASRPPGRPPLLAVVAHDLRQPTSAALMAAEFADELLDSCASAASVRQQLAVIRRCMRDALRLTQDLLTFGQAEAGALRLRREPLDAVALLHEAAVNAGPAARAKRVDVQVAAAGPAPAVRADHQRLLQVLMNLCDNATKFTAPGGTIRLGVTSDATAVQFHVTDSGPGVPDALLARVFDQYWRAEGRPPGGGVGLGLSIAKWFVELHGGDIRAVNAPGGGLTVAFTIPLDSCTDAHRADSVVGDG